MKLLAITIMLAALFLLYRIAYPKQIKKEGENPPGAPENSPDVMGKSRFVVPDRSKPLQTPTTLIDSEKAYKEVSIFAAEINEKRSVKIPPELMEDIFGKDTIPMMSMELETENEEEGEVDFEAEEEAESLNRVLGYEPQYAEGVEYNDLQTAAKTVDEQPEEVNDQTVGTFIKLEHTDMFEWMVSGEEGKRDWINAVIERSIQNRMSETEETTLDTDYGDFDVADFINNKKPKRQ
jgi:hypothetical protein